MIPKKEPKFKLGLTEEEITPRAGLAMYHESLDRSGIIDLIDKMVPSPGSKRGYNPSAYIAPLIKDSYGVTTDRLIGDRLIGESVYCLNDTEPFRIVSLKWLKKDPPLFGEKYNYHAIATNLECPLNEVIYNYNKRVNIENHIKELKNGFSLEQMPSGDFYANAFVFRHRGFDL